MRGLILLAVVTLAYAKSIEQSETLSAYGYIRRVAIPLADEIRKQEELLLKQRTSGRIAGGTCTPSGKIPYQAGVITQYIGIDRSSICGGSLVSNTKVVYAAHCWFDGRDQGFVVEIVLGSTTVFYGGHRQSTSNVIIHPNFDISHLSNDVGIITLNNAVQFSNTIAPIALPSGSQLDDRFVDESVVASGYGRTGDSGDAAIIGVHQTLSHVTLRVITNEECRQHYRFNVIDSTICTSGIGGTSICGGDSGGPLAATRDGRLVLVGITSFGSPWGCTRGSPSGFARVTSFVEFINQHM